MLLNVILRIAGILLVFGVIIDSQPLDPPLVAGASATHTIAELSWMSGDWQTPSGGRAQIEEHWTPAAGGTMFGVSRTIAGGRTVEFEFLKLEERGGEVFYVAHPKARCPGTDFKLTSVSRQSATFENPQHDFPKRISYRKTETGGLTATIDGGEGTKSQSFAFQQMK